MKRCPGCNHQIPDSAQSCDYCGISLRSVAGAAGGEAKRQSTFSFAPDAGKEKRPEARRPSAPIAEAPGGLGERKPPSAEPPLVMVGGRLDELQARRPAAQKAPQLPTAPIGLDEAFKAGLDLVSNAVQILRGTWKIRSLNQQRAHAFEGLARGVWNLQLRHRDLSPIFDRILEIERQEAEKRAAVVAIEQEPLSEDRDIAKAEKALQKIKIKKLNQTVAALGKAKSPIFRELGKVANELKIPSEELNPAYAYLDDLTQRIGHMESLVENARSAVRSIDKRKKEFTYLFWTCLIFMGIIIAWALFDVIRAPG